MYGQVRCDSYLGSDYHQTASIEARPHKTSIHSTREVKRLDSITRSPIYADAGTTLAGAKVIRAFKAEEAIHRRFLGFLDDNGKCYFCFLIISRHLGFRLDNLCAYFMASLCILAVSLRVE